jgi:hypothetical protein
MTMTCASSTAADPATRRIRRGLAVLMATGVAVAVWFVAAVLGGVDLTVRRGAGTDTVTLAAVVGAAVLAGLAGWALLAVLERFTRRPRRIWTVVAVTVFALSMLGPIGSAEGPLTMFVLGTLHAGVAAALVRSLRCTAAR